MVYIIRSAEELELLRLSDDNYWLGSHMYRYAGAVVHEPIHKVVDGYSVLDYKDYYWHPETYRPIELKDLKDIVYISEEDLKEMEA